MDNTSSPPSTGIESRWVPLVGDRRGPHGYRRRSAGLIRPLSRFDALIGNILLVNFVAAAATITVIPFAFPGANLPIAVFLGLVPALVLGTVYVLFAVALPRSGGEYVYISRIFRPAVGFAANFSFIVWNILFGGLLANQLSTVYLASFFSAMGWPAATEAMADKMVILIIGTVLIVAVTLAVVIGTRFAMTLMKSMFYLGSAGLLATLAALAFAGRDDFLAGVGGKQAYDHMLASATAAGWQPGGSSVVATLQAVALVSLATLFVMCSTYTTGEVSDAKRSVPVAVYGSAVVGVAVMLAMALAADGIFGSDFMAASTYLTANDPDNYLLASEPSFAYFATLTLPGWLFATVLNVGFLCLIVGNMIFATQAMSRCFIAWAQDRIAPLWLARISTRRHTPTNALLTFGGLSLVSLVYYTLDGDVTFLAGATLGFIATFLTVSLAAMAFPYVKSDVYRESAIDYSVLGIPVISVAGAISTVLLSSMVYAFLTNDAFEANGIVGLLFLGGFWLLGMAIYFLARFVHTRRGLPFEAAFREVPAR